MFLKSTMLLKDKSIIMVFLRVASYSSAYIFGPMLVLGIAGYITDRYLETSPIILLISIGIAFIVSNVLLFKKRSALSKNLLRK